MTDDLTPEVLARWELWRDSITAPGAEHEGRAPIASAAEHEAEFDRWLAVHDARIIELETERDNAIRLAGQNHTAYLDAIGAPIR